MGEIGLIQISHFLKKLFSLSVLGFEHQMQLLGMEISVSRLN